MYALKYVVMIAH